MTRAFAALILAILAGCGGGGGSSSPPTTPPATKAFYASWTSAPQDLTEGLPGQPHVTPDFIADRTIREVAHLSVGGDTLRIKLSNRFGATPLVLDAVHVAGSVGATTIDLASVGSSRSADRRW